MSNIYSNDDAIELIAKSMEESRQPQYLQYRDSLYWKETDRWPILIREANKGSQIRVRPRIKTIYDSQGHEVEIPTPRKEKPSRYEAYWLLFDEETLTPRHWEGKIKEVEWLANNRCFSTQERRNKVERILTELLETK